MSRDKRRKIRTLFTLCFRRARGRGRPRPTHAEGAAIAVGAAETVEKGVRKVLFRLLPEPVE